MSGFPLPGVNNGFHNKWPLAYIWGNIYRHKNRSQDIYLKTPIFYHIPRSDISCKNRMSTPAKNKLNSIRATYDILKKYENAWALTRPPATYPCQYSCPIDLLAHTFDTLQQLIAITCVIVTSYYGVTSCHGVTSYHGVTSCHDNMDRHASLHRNSSETPKVMFFNIVTLTFDLWPWTSNSSKILSRSLPVPNLAPIRQTVWPVER